MKRYTFIIFLMKFFLQSIMYCCNTLMHGLSQHMESCDGWFGDPTGLVVAFDSA